MKVIRTGSISLEKFANKFNSRCVEDTIDLGQDIMADFVDKLSTKSVVIALQGGLGAGKTQFIKGAAKALGITTTITSPTYQIMKEYEYECGKVGGKLVHIAL